MKEFLSPGHYIDSNHPAVIEFARRHVKGSSDVERAVSLYYAVRDGIRYNPFLDFSQDSAYRGSRCLEAGEGFCIGKAALLAQRWRPVLSGNVAMPGTDHFTVIDGLADPGNALFAAARRMMGLGK